MSGAGRFGELQLHGWTPVGSNSNNRSESRDTNKSIDSRVVCIRTVATVVTEMTVVTVVTLMTQVKVVTVVTGVTLMTVATLVTL